MIVTLIQSSLQGNGQISGHFEKSISGFLGQQGKTVGQMW